VHTHDLTTVGVLLATGQAEQILIQEQRWAGLIPESVTRPMYPWEVQAGVNFAEINRTLDKAQSQTAAALDGLRDTILSALGSAVAGQPDEAAAQAALLRFTATQPAEVRRAIRDTTDLIQSILNDLYSNGADQVVREATGQGITPSDALLEGVTPTPAQFVGTASVAPVSVWTRMVDVAVKVGGGRPPSGSAILAAVSAVVIKGAYDLARQATNVVHGLGRKAALDDLPAPTLSYSSEILDGNQCEQCDFLDGTRFTTLDEAFTYYPDTAPMIDCLGGDRCRGMLLFIWSGEL